MRWQALLQRHLVAVPRELEFTLVTRKSSRIQWSRLIVASFRDVTNRRSETEVHQTRSSSSLVAFLRARG